MTPIVCASGVPLLMDYLEGVLPADIVAAVEAHVAGCPRCTAFIASYLATPRILREATAPEFPPALQRSLRTWLREQRGEPPTRPDG
jgi:anti-sigma factor RsiW